jgi:hypothetical protein
MEEVHPPAKYRAFAGECLSWAIRARDQEQRNRLVEIARNWMKIALEIERISAPPAHKAEGAVPPELSPRKCHEGLGGAAPLNEAHVRQILDAATGRPRMTRAEFEAFCRQNINAGWAEVETAKRRYFELRVIK